MKDLRKHYPKMYAEWVFAGLSTFAVPPPPAAAAVPVPAPKIIAQVAANEEWEDEGGSIEASIKPVGSKPAPKIPL